TGTRIELLFDHRFGRHESADHVRLDLLFTWAVVQIVESQFRTVDLAGVNNKVPEYNMADLVTHNEALTGYGHVLSGPDLSLSSGPVLNQGSSYRRGHPVDQRRDDRYCFGFW